MNTQKTWQLNLIIVVMAFIGVRCGTSDLPGAKTPQPGGTPAAAVNNPVSQVPQTGSVGSGSGVVANATGTSGATDTTTATTTGTTPSTTTAAPGSSPTASTGVAAFIQQLINGFSQGGGGLLGAKEDIGPGCLEGDPWTCQAEASLVKYTNDVRAKNSKSPLTQDFRLSDVARDWSVKQGAMISHTGFPTARVAVFQQKFPGVSVPQIAGENVAMNGASSSDADGVAKMFSDMWEASPGHFANMIGPYRYIGVGVSCPGHKDATTTNTQPAANNGDLASLISSLFSGIGGGSCTGTQIFAG